MCYELFVHLRSLLCTDCDSYDDGTLLGMMRFMAYHEIGHALIDILSLPAVGREESVADQFAAYMVIDHDYVSRAPLIDARLFFQLLDIATPETEAAKADTHLLNAQRDADLACWLIATGMPPDQVRLSPDREKTCNEEVRLQEARWEQLLGRYLKVHSRKR